VGVDAKYTADAGTPHVLTPMGELYMPLKGIIDIEAEMARLDREIDKTMAELEKTSKRLSDKTFTEKAPDHVVEEFRARKAEGQAKLKKLKNMKEALAG
jgi:valyl-tRNA synthetase